MKWLRWLKQAFWQWVPHWCRFEESAHELFGIRGWMCRRCGDGVWWGEKK